MIFQLFVCFSFFEQPDYMRIARRILCSVGDSRKGGGLPYLALTVIYNVPLSRAWFLGSWTGILYKNVKVGYKHSTFVV